MACKRYVIDATEINEIRLTDGSLFYDMIGCCFPMNNMQENLWTCSVNKLYFNVLVYGLIKL